MADTAKITLHIGGMDCNNCATSITNTLRKKGLEDANVNFATGEAIFTPKNLITQEEIIQSIKELGYQVLFENANGELKKPWFSLQVKLIICSIFTVPLLLHMLPIPFLQNPTLQLLLSLPVMVIGGWHFGKSAFGSLKAKVPNMDVLIFIGGTAAFVYSIVGSIITNEIDHAHHYLFFETAASIFTLVLLGNYIEHKAVNQTTSSIKELSKIKPIEANFILSFNGKEKIMRVAIKEIKKDDVVLVNPGDRIPVDGEIILGESEVDESMITGESLPARKKIGQKVVAGTINLNSSLRIRTEQTGKETVISAIIDMIKQAQFEKPKIQELGDKISAIFVPVVLLISLLTFLINYFVADNALYSSIMNAVAVLVISCPCAMGLATPTAVMVGIGRAAKAGILIKGGKTLQQMAELKNILFDKTGTLTTGKFVIQNIKLIGSQNEEEIRGIILTLEKNSSHPIAKSLVHEISSLQYKDVALSEIKEVKGSGMSGKDAHGNNYFFGVGFSTTDTNSLVSLNLIKNEVSIAEVELKDEVRVGTKEAIGLLKRQNVDIAMLSGDLPDKCKDVAQEIGIISVYARQNPSKKLNVIKNFMKSGPTAMVGDGINDAPSLAASTIGISLGNANDIAIQSSNVVILRDDLRKVSEALQIGKHTLITIKQNLFWAFFYNVVAIPIAAFGYLNPMVGAIAMALSDVIVIGNSIRLKYKKIK